LGLRLQITRTTPRRRITLQCSQIGRTLERTFHLVVPLDHLTQPGHFRIAQVAHACVRADARLRENAHRVAGTDAEDVRQCVLDFLVARQIHTCNTSHASP